MNKLPQDIEWSLNFEQLPVDGLGWLGSRVVSVLDSGAEGPGFKSQLRRCRITSAGLMPTEARGNYLPEAPLITYARKRPI